MIQSVGYEMVRIRSNLGYELVIYPLTEPSLPTRKGTLQSCLLQPRRFYASHYIHRLLDYQLIIRRVLRKGLRSNLPREIGVTLHRLTAYALPHEVLKSLSSALGAAVVHSQWVTMARKKEIRFLITYRHIQPLSSDALYA